MSGRGLDSEWGGSLQLVADMIKMFFKEDWIPKFSDRVIFTLAPMIAFTSLLLAFAATIYPSWRASRVNPAEALRYE